MVHNVLRIIVQSWILRYLIAGILVALKIEYAAEYFVARIRFHMVVPTPLSLREAIVNPKLYEEPLFSIWCEDVGKFLACIVVLALVLV